MYATIDDVRNFVWTEYSDSKIESMLSYLENDITDVVGDISYSVKYEDISLCKIYDNSVLFNNIEIKEILEVDEKQYTLWYEILSPQNRKVVFEDLSKNVDMSLDRSTFRIKYLSWFVSVPEDLILAHALLVSAMLEGGWKQIAKYKMWPRSVEYAAWASETYKNKAEKILNRYRLLRI